MSFDITLRSPSNFDVILADPSSGGKIKVWTGSAWVEYPVKYWNGSGWVEKPLKRWNGSSWVLT